MNKIELFDIVENHYAADTNPKKYSLVIKVSAQSVHTINKDGYIAKYSPIRKDKESTSYPGFTYLKVLKKTNINILLANVKLQKEKNNE